MKFVGLGEEYVFTWPSYYAKGLLVGTLKMECSGKAEITCAKSGYTVELEFKNKGFLRGENNSVVGKIKQGKTTVYNIDGKWDSQVFYYKSKSDRTVLLDISPEVSPYSNKQLLKVQDMKDHESRRLWRNVTAALKQGDVNTATSHKLALEDAQREGAKQRKETGSDWSPSVFVAHADGTYSFRKPSTTVWSGNDAEEAEYEKEFMECAGAGALATPGGVPPTSD